KIGFTGETGTGKQVARSAADELKHVTLELGGSDAAIVCDDADLDLAARNVAIGRFFNAGQACLAIKRVFVFEAVAEEFISKVAARAKRLKLGSGMDESAQMGPLHSEKQRAEIERSSKTPSPAEERSWPAANARPVLNSRRAITSNRRSSSTCPTGPASGPKRRSVRCYRSCGCALWTRRSRKPTRRCTAWDRASLPA